MKQDRIRRIASLSALLTPLLVEHQALADGAKDDKGEDRGFTHDEFEKHAKLAPEIANLTQEIDHLQTEIRAIDAIAQDYDEQADKTGFSGLEQLPQNTLEYRETFAKAVCGGNGKGPNVEAVNRLRELTGPNFQNLTGETPSSGAILIPTVIVQQIMMEAEKASALMRVSDVSSTSIVIQSMPFLDELGVMAPRSQGDSYMKASPNLVAKNRNIYNFGLLWSVSQELLEDVPTLEAALARNVGRSAGYTVEEYGFKGVNGQDAFTNQADAGVTLDHTNKVPTGILEEPAENVAEVTAAATTLYTYDELIEVKQAVDPTADAGASWVCSRGFETAALTLKDSQGRPLWQPAIAAGTPNMIGGSPYALSTRLGPMTTGQTVAVYGDFRSAHKIDIKKDFVLKTSEHFYFGAGMIAYAGDMRFGSIVTLKNYLSKLTLA